MPTVLNRPRVSKTRKPNRKPALEKPIPATLPELKGAAKPGTAWEVYDSNDLELLGYLVTAPNDPNRPLAYVVALYDEESPTGRRERRELVAVAESIAADTRLIEQYIFRLGDEPHVIIKATKQAPVVRDFRDYCTLDSQREMRPEVYGWILTPIDHGPNDDREDCNPFCYFRFARMLHQYTQLAFTDKDRETFGPCITAGLSTPDNGQGLDHIIDAGAILGKLDREESKGGE